MTETTEWSATDIKNVDDASLYLLESFQWDDRPTQESLIAILQDIANSKWMQQRAKDGKQVILAGKG